MSQINNDFFGSSHEDNQNIDRFRLQKLITLISCSEVSKALTVWEDGYGALMIIDHWHFKFALTCISTKNISNATLVSFEACLLIHDIVCTV